MCNPTTGEAEANSSSAQETLKLINVFSIEPDDLDWMPRIHAVGENQLPKVIF